jgi:Putative beta-barrel porin 2
VTLSPTILPLGKRVRSRFLRAEHWVYVAFLFALLSHSGKVHGQVLVAAPEIAPPAEPAPPGFGYYANDYYSFDDNIFRLPANYAGLEGILGPGATRGDEFNRVTVGADGNWFSGLQNVQLDLHLSRDDYSHYGFLDNYSRAEHLAWNWQATNLLSGKIGLDQDVELASFAFNRVFAKDLLDTFGYFGLGRLQLGPEWALIASTRRSDTNHSLDSLSGEDSRNTSGAVGIEYALAESSTLELQYKYSNGEYPHELVGPEAISSDFHDSTTQLLLHYEPSDKTVVVANGGYLRRIYQDPRLGAFSGEIWHASFDWKVTDKTELLAAVGRDLTAYVDAASDYFVANERSVTLNWTPRTAFQVALIASWQHQDYIPSATASPTVNHRIDDLNDQRIKATYLPRTWLSFDLSAALEQRNSDDPTFSFKDRIIKAGFKVAF